ncbi:hypothetical protein AB0M57_04810 [Streptomyces sp. NPDC051597]|uniref:hypothetical protein n=1 Tax=Streptomyces sp. NPDC051597 TaxID=3155049 RepID=UPI0034150E7D
MSEGSSALAVHSDLANAITQQSRLTGAADPTVRGADWRLAVVQSVGSDGTVTTNDGIVARRLESYSNPQSLDLIVIDVSGSGSWLARGRLGTGTGNWTTFTLSGSWAANASYYTPAYQVHGDGTASLSGLAQLSGSLADGATVATLPSEATPRKQVRRPVQVAVGFFGVMTILNTGAVQLGDFSGTLPATGNKYAEYDVMARYRLT